MQTVTRDHFNQINFERFKAQKERDILKKENAKLKRLINFLLKKNKEVADWLPTATCGDSWREGCAERTAAEFLLKDIKVIEKKLKQL